MQDVGLNWTKFGSGHNSFQKNNVLRAKHDRLVEIVRANPEISTAEISNQFYPIGTCKHSRRHLGSMLLDVCSENRIKCLPGDHYIVPQAQ
jgi:hypothetical protein